MNGFERAMRGAKRAIRCA